MKKPIAIFATIITTALSGSAFADCQAEFGPWVNDSIIDAHGVTQYGCTNTDTGVFYMDQLPLLRFQATAKGICEDLGLTLASLANLRAPDAINALGFYSDWGTRYRHWTADDAGKKGGVQRYYSYFFPLNEVRASGYATDYAFFCVDDPNPPSSGGGSGGGKPNK